MAINGRAIPMFTIDTRNNAILNMLDLMALTFLILLRCARPVRTLTLPTG